MDLTHKITNFPGSPGVYLMKDGEGRIIYVGKAIDLKKRVSQYLPRESGSAGSSESGGLGESAETPPRFKDNRYQIRFLMNRVTDIDCVVTDNEKEALLLENTLIKKHRPRYNIVLKDDKSYVSIKFSLKDEFPRLYVTRTIRKDGSLYFGPYSSAAAARETVEFIEKYFRLRNCSDHEFANRVRPCLQYQMHRCDAPCVQYISRENYKHVADQAKLFLQGRKGDLVKELEKDMEAQAEREEFEKAANTRDLLSSIRETLEKQKVDRHQWLDQDAIGYYREGSHLTFCVLMIREGKMWESLLFHVKGEGETEDLLSSFLEQFYGEDRVLPDEILIPADIPSRAALTEILIERDPENTKIEILIPQRGDRMDLVSLAGRNAREGFERRSQKHEETRDTLIGLQEDLGLQNFPRRMECFDISNISGEHSVGSLVCFVDGLMYRKGYRRFRIKTVQGPDDFASMKEVLSRRLLHLPESGGSDGPDDRDRWVRPDLLVIDGGKGQLNAVQTALEELNVTGVDLISLAKGDKVKPGESGSAGSDGGGVGGTANASPHDQDKVYIPGRKNSVPLRSKSELHLLMRIRDEAHRFAITYHRNLRSKAFLPKKKK